ncbi:hypothetical protein EDP1_3986 [Pseudomonas putida S610]|nr:hypothetical protein EDP1_3986 [Pseudomonas putida S610]
MHVLLVQFGCQGSGAHTGRCQGQHCRITLAKAGHFCRVPRRRRQLALLLRERALVTLASVDFHQFQAQIITPRRAGDCRLQQLGGTVQATLGNAHVRLGQQGSIRVCCRLTHRLCSRLFSGRCRCRRGGDRRGRQGNSRGHDFDPIKAVVLWIETLDLLLFQSARHAQMLLGFLLGPALTRQQPEQQRQDQDGRTGDQPQQPAASQDVVKFAVRLGFGGRRLGVWRSRGRWRDHGLIGNGRLARRRDRIGHRHSRLGRRQGLLTGFARNRRCWRRGSRTLSFQPGQLIVLELDQALQLVQLALQVGHATFEFFVVTAAGVKAFLCHCQLVVQCLGLTGARLVAGADQAQVVALGDGSGCGVCGTTAGSVELAGTWPQASTLAPGRVLLGDLAIGFTLGNALDLLLIGQAQYLAHLELVDVVADERIRVQRLDCDHGLLNRAALGVARRDLPQGIAALGRIAARGGGRSGDIACSGLRILGFGLIQQDAVVTQQAALRPHHLYQELDHRPRQGLAGGYAKHASAIGVDHGREAQVLQGAREGHACLGELLRRSQARCQLRRGQVTHIEQFDFGLQRLVLRRLQGQLSQAQSVGHARGQRRGGCHGQNQFADSKHELFPCMDRPETCRQSRTKVPASIFYRPCLINNCATCTALSAAPLRTLSVVNQRLSCWV